MNFFKRTRSKYKSVKTADGFPSKLEASVYQLLLLLESSGKIMDICRQVVIPLTKAKINYHVDFSYVEKESGEIIYVEAKGFETDVWKIKKRLWVHYGPGRLEIYKGTYLRPYLNETVESQKE